ncbi:MAG: RNA polymerase sigma-70 factor [Marinifilaceae bacterium]|jgi:RNA polymerase sigma-70 factor (ECF subfamily)|nr:RNA polymerase sigma-70 factor [Marinifilaceae bacterium]
MSENRIILNDLIRKPTKKKYEVFFKAYYKDLFLWAYSIVKDTCVAEDIVQDFFVDFWENKRCKNITTNPQSYLYTSIRNLCINYINKGKIGPINNKYEYNEDTIRDVEQEFDYEMSQQIYSAINQLPNRCKEVFVLCCMNSYSYQEVADDLDISINTVRTHMLKAFRVLREKLKSPYLFYFLYTDSCI